MTLGQMRSRDLKRASALLLILGAAFAFYFFHFVRDRSQDLRERNLRELATLSRQIENAFSKAQKSRDSTQDCSKASKGIGGDSEAGEAPWLAIEPRGSTNFVHFSHIEKCFFLKEILQPIAWPDDLFDQFLLVEQESRRVLLPLTSLEVRLASLDLGESKPLPSRSHYQVLEIGGQSYDLFLQPVLVRSSQESVDRPTPPLTLALAGLVSSDRLVAEASRIPPPLLVGLLSLAAFLILLLPFLKVGLQAPHERLRKLDLIQLAVASAFGLALAVILCLVLWTHHALQKKVDSGLRTISDELGETLEQKPADSTHAYDERSEDKLSDDELEYLMNLTLPVDLGVAIVNSSWKVLFHSDLRRKGQDNFLGACDFSRRLERTFLAAGSETKSLDLDYLGKPYRVLVSRLKGRPLWLVALHQKGALHGLHLDLMLWAYAGLITYFAALLLVALLGGWIWALVSGRRVWLMGSDEQFFRGDLRLTAVFVLISVWALTWLVFAPLESRALMVVAAPLTAIVFLASRLIWKRTQENSRRISITRGIPLLVWAVFLCLDLWLTKDLRALWAFVPIGIAVPLWLSSHGENQAVRLQWLQKGGGLVLGIAVFLGVVIVLPTFLLGSVLLEYDYATLVWRDHEHLASTFNARNESSDQLWGNYEDVLFGTTIGCGASCVPTENEESDLGSKIVKLLERLHERLPLSRQRLDDLTDGANGVQTSLAGELATKDVTDGNILSSGTIGSVCWHLSSPTRLDGVWFGWHLLVALVGLSFFVMICLTARHLLRVGLDPEDPRRALPTLESNHLWWATPLEKAKISFPPDSEDTTWIDLGTDSGRRLLEGGKLPPVTPRTVLVPAAATADEPSSVRVFLKLLDRLTDEETMVVVVATGLPEAGKLLDWAFSTTPAETGSPEDPAKASTTEEMSSADALAVLARFTVLPCPDILGKKLPEDLPSRDTTSPSDNTLEADLAREAGAHAQLRKAGGWLLKVPGCDAWRGRRLFDRLALAATFYYRWLWESCSEPEKIALFQLARESVANPRAREALQGLLNKRLLELAPHRGLHVFNQSFRRWVKQAGRSENLMDKERARGGWLDARRTVLVALLGLACFVLTTQQDIFESLGSLKEVFVTGVTILTAIVGAVAGLGRFFNKPLLGVDAE